MNLRESYEKLRQILGSFENQAHGYYVLVATNKGMQAVKLCSNKILQFLIGEGVLYNTGCPV